MSISVAAAARELEGRQLLTRMRKNQPERIISRIRELVGGDLPEDLIDFYHEQISKVAEYSSILPDWNPFVGWRTADDVFIRLLSHNAIPIFADDFGNLYGLDLSRSPACPAVYFFDHDREDLGPIYAAGSSLGAFMLLLAEQDRAFEEGWPPCWELAIDPDLESCPRAPPIWAAG